ncbi:hypothetical protein V6Z11_D07G229100 [Gossypium hirsutum]
MKICWTSMTGDLYISKYFGTKIKMFSGFRRLNNGS